jgi:ABC-type sulfate transport system substrate-binding protein
MKKHNRNNRRKVALAQREIDKALIHSEKELNELDRQKREKDYKRIVEEIKTLQNRISLSTTEQ